MPAAFEVGVLKRKGIMTVLFVNLVCSRIIWEEHLSEELSRSGWPKGTSVGIVFIVNGCGKNQLTVGDTIP